MLRWLIKYSPAEQTGTSSMYTSRYKIMIMIDNKEISTGTHLCAHRQMSFIMTIYDKVQSLVHDHLSRCNLCWRDRSIEIMITKYF